VGRRGPLEVGFSLKELGELGSLDGVSTTAEPAQMPTPLQLASAGPVLAKVLGVIAGFAACTPQPDSKRLHLQFQARPVAVLGEDRVTGVRFERTIHSASGWEGTGEYFDHRCTLVVTCIGYRVRPIPGVPLDTARGVLANVNGEIQPGLFCSGWAARPPTGTIGSNRQQAFDLAARIAATCSPGKPGRVGLRALLGSRRIATVDFAGWRRIDTVEIASARPGAPREKLPRWTELLHAAGAKNPASEMST
jgi:ferredoxin--NADP+ reductase